MTTISDHEPCPHCGSLTAPRVAMGEHPTQAGACCVYVQCPLCGARGPMRPYRQGHMTDDEREAFMAAHEEEAWELWDLRIPYEETRRRRRPGAAKAIAGLLRGKGGDRR